MRRTIAAIGAVLASCEQNAPPPEEHAPAMEAPAENATELDASPLDRVIAPSVNNADASNAGACRTQDGKEIAANRLKATGTEPFWSAAIEGRCVTYRTPENHSGTRIWATFTGSRDFGQWAGFLANERFVLMTTQHANCSDGMSDRSYPIAVTLTIGSDERRGCAAPD
jgi:uncharacterized membrane protein